jgi:ankyrin repeat protein
MTCLIYATANKRLDIIKYLLDNGYDVNHFNEHSDLALIYAVHYNYPDVIDLLLDYNPDLELKSKKLQTTALEAAIYRNKEFLVEKLLAKGARFSIESYKNSRK